MNASGFRQHTINTPYMVGPVHCYSARLEGELVLFDTGPPTEEAKRYLADNLALAELRHVFITHGHIDHYGLAAWLEDNSDATIYLPYRDCLKIRHHEERIVGMGALLREAGFSLKYLEELRQIFASGVLFPPFPKKFLATEESLPAHLGITALACPGHSQSDMVYFGTDWAVTGDTLLQGIFQCPLLDLDLVEGGRFKNYEAYCRTIVKLAGLENKTVLPGHRQTNPGVLRTLFFYNEKLLRRVQGLLPYRQEKNLMVLIDKLLDGRMQDPFSMYLKASEIIFMQDFLRQPELLKEALMAIHLFDELSELYAAAVHDVH